MAGSDFEPDKPVIKEDGSDVPTLTRSGSSFSRKRSYEDADHGDEKLRQQDDYTKRKRRSQVESAYR
jgi:Zn-finger nucleic acid-binding protein